MHSNDSPGFRSGIGSHIDVSTFGSLSSMFVSGTSPSFIIVKLKYMFSPT